MKDILIAAEKITKEYKLTAETIYAVRDLDLEVRRGDFIAIMGPSGSGKTTLLDILGCLDRISRGRLEVFGQDVSRARENTLVAMRRKNLGFIFQEFLLIPTLTALENVALPLQFARTTRPRKDLVALLEKVGLGHRVHHLPKQLSGGERQRVAVARALAISPQVLIADEPTGNLDTHNSQQIFDIFRQLNREENLTIVIATHDRNLGSQATSMIQMQDGMLLLQK